MRETLESLKQLLKKQIRQVVDKGDMTPSELEEITKAMCLYNMVEDNLMLESGYSGFSNGYSSSYRMNDTNGWSANGTYSRARNPRNGQYMSRDYDMGRSGHSVNDRMIAALEQMMDQASNDYERQQVMRQIEKMRGGEM